MRESTNHHLARHADGSAIGDLAAALLTTVLVLAADAASAEVSPEINLRPYLQGLTSTSVTIRWRTETPHNGRVRYGRVVDRGRETLPIEKDEVEDTKVHAIELCDLHPDTHYFYEVLGQGDVLASGEGFRFTTAPPPGEGSVDVLALGDSGQENSPGLSGVAEIAGRLERDIIVHTGDVTYNGSLLETVLFEPYSNVLSNACLFTARGNHDGFTWNEYFSVPGDCNAKADHDRVYFSFDWGPVHFSVLDCPGQGHLCLGSEETEQSRWLAEDLNDARSRKMPWLVLVLHESPYTIGGHADGDTAARRSVPPIADALGVDLVITGHDHNYQRSWPIRNDVVRDPWQDPAYAAPGGTIYLVTGGGGALPAPTGSGDVARANRRFNRVFHQGFHAVHLHFTQERVNAEVVDVEENIIDSFSISKTRRNPEFLRGDVNFDGIVDLSDGIAILGSLFLGGRLVCPVVGDMNNNELPLSLTDAIYLFQFLYLGGPPPLSPFPDCGTAVNADGTECFCASCGGCVGIPAR